MAPTQAALLPSQYPEELNLPDKISSQQNSNQEFYFQTSQPNLSPANHRKLQPSKKRDRTLQRPPE